MSKSLERNQDVDYLSVSAIVSAQATVGLDVDVLVSNFIRIHNDSTYNEMVIGQWVVWAMSLGSNILATVLIGYKAWSVVPFYYRIFL